MKKVIFSDNAPRAIGPYSQCISCGPLLFISGQLPIDPASGQMVEGDIRSQTRQTVKNIISIVESAGGTVANLVKTTIFLKDLSLFDEVNLVYAQYFSSGYPARSTVEVSRLPKDSQIEIEAVAYLG
ncbi:MAG: RidA family protein [Desulfocucumaceae bacterium]